MNLNISKIKNKNYLLCPYIIYLFNNKIELIRNQIVLFIQSIFCKINEWTSRVNYVSLVGHQHNSAEVFTVSFKAMVNFHWSSFVSVQNAMLVLSRCALNALHYTISTITSLSTCSMTLVQRNCNRMRVSIVILTNYWPILKHLGWRWTNHSISLRSQ